MIPEQGAGRITDRKQAAHGLLMRRFRDRSRVGATATVPEGPSEQGLGAVAASVVARDAAIEVVNMLGIGPIPVAGNDPIGSPFVTTMDWTAFAVAVAAFVVLFLVAVIVATAGRRVREAPVSPRLRPQAA